MRHACHKPDPDLAPVPTDARARFDREIDEMVTDFHARLPRERTVAVAVLYARYSSPKQASITDQVRTMLEWALGNNLFVPREFIFFDVAIRGAKARRPGLDAARLVLKAGRVKVFACFATNRLFRKAYRAMQFMDEEIVDKGIRGVFVKAGIDTDNKQVWKLAHQLHAMNDELMACMYSENIRAAHEGKFLRGQVCTTIAFGFRGRELPGPLTRRGRPLRDLEVDPETAKYVLMAYRWFVDDGLSILEIVRRFNADPNVPKSPKSPKGAPWTHTAVRLLLANPRYRGQWAYGRTKAIWQAKADYVRQIPRDTPLREEQREDLRIVDDELWWRAASKLQANHNNGGRRPGEGNSSTRPHLFRGMFICAAHNQPLYVGGAHGRMLYCRGCQQVPEDGRPLFSQLNRALANRLTCEALADRVRRDPTLVADVVAHCRKAAAEAGDDTPGRLSALVARRDAFTAKITLLMNNLGETEADQRESNVQLSNWRRDRAGLEAEIAALRAARDRPRVVPDEAEARALIDRLGEVLVAAGSDPGGDPRAREVIRLLTGGRIELEQRGEPRSHGGWLRGHIHVRLVAGVAAALGGPECDATGDDATELIIDYREPTSAEIWADRVKALYDEDLLVAEIARRLGIRANQAAQALQHWHTARGLPLPDGRTRRAAIENARKITPATPG